MRSINRVLAVPVFWLARMMFHASAGQKLEKKHRFVMKLFRFAADNGYTPALSLYGHLLHFRGDGIQNRIQGGIYLQQAAEKGDSKAQYQMARIYEQGYEHYFQPDSVEALAFYRQAAEQGHQLAIQRLLKVYEAGELGQSPDPDEARRWQERKPVLPA